MPKLRALYPKKNLPPPRVGLMTAVRKWWAGSPYVDLPSLAGQVVWTGRTTYEHVTPSKLTVRFNQDALKLTDAKGRDQTYPYANGTLEIHYFTPTSLTAPPRGRSRAFLKLKTGGRTVYQDVAFNAAAIRAVTKFLFANDVRFKEYMNGRRALMGEYHSLVERAELSRHYHNNYM